MSTTITMNKTDYINFIHKLRNEFNSPGSTYKISTERVQDMVAKSLGYENHVAALSYFDNDIKEKEAKNFAFKKKFYYCLDLQWKEADSLTHRVLFLVELIFTIAEYKNYKLSSRSVERILPLDYLIDLYKDKKTSDNIKNKIHAYFETLNGFTSVRRINNVVRDQHQNNVPYILIASKMSNPKTEK